MVDNKWNVPKGPWPFDKAVRHNYNEGHRVAPDNENIWIDPPMNGSPVASRKITKEHSPFCGYWPNTGGGSTGSGLPEENPKMPRFIFMLTDELVCLSITGYGDVWLVSNTYLTMIELATFKIVNVALLDNYTKSSVGLLPNAGPTFGNTFTQLSYAGGKTLVASAATAKLAGAASQSVVVNESLDIINSVDVDVNAIGYRWLFPQVPTADGKLYQLSMYYHTDGVHISVYGGSILLDSFKIVAPVAGYVAGFCSNITPEGYLYILYDDAAYAHHILKYDLHAKAFILDGAAPKEYLVFVDNWSTGSYFNYELMAVTTDGVLNIVVTDSNTSTESALRVAADGTLLAPLNLTSKGGTMLWYDPESATLSYFASGGQTPIVIVDLMTGATLMNKDFGYITLSSGLSARVSSVTAHTIQGGYLFIPMYHYDATGLVAGYMTKIELATGNIVDKIGPLSTFGTPSSNAMLVVDGDFVMPSPVISFHEPASAPEILPAPYNSRSIPPRYPLS